VLIWTSEKKIGCLYRKKVLEIEMQSKRKAGRPTKRFMDAIKDGMKEVGVAEGDAHNTRPWQPPSKIGSSNRKKKKKKWKK